MSAVEIAMAVAVLAVYLAVLVWLLRLLVRSVRDIRRDGLPSWDDLRDAFAALRLLPDVLADGMDRWVMSQHQPLDPDELVTPCLGCRNTSWPCERFVDAADRIASRAPLGVSDQDTTPRR